MSIWNPECVCGHVDEEHEQGFFRPCTIPDCECEDFEHADEGTDDEEDEL